MTHLACLFDLGLICGPVLGLGALLLGALGWRSATEQECCHERAE